MLEPETRKRRPRRRTRPRDGRAARQRHDGSAHRLAEVDHQLGVGCASFGSKRGRGATTSTCSGIDRRPSRETVPGDEDQGHVLPVDRRERNGGREHSSVSATGPRGRHRRAGSSPTTEASLRVTTVPHLEDRVPHPRVHAGTSTRSVGSGPGHRAGSRARRSDPRQAPSGSRPPRSATYRHWPRPASAARRRPGIHPPSQPSRAVILAKPEPVSETFRGGLRSRGLRRGAGMELRRLLGGLLAVTACGTVEPGPDPGSTLTIREMSLPGAVVGSPYEDLAVALEAEGAQGAVQWSLPLLPSSLAWLSVEPGSGRLGGLSSTWSPAGGVPPRHRRSWPPARRSCPRRRLSRGKPGRAES